MKLITGQFNDSFPPVMDGVANVTKNYAYWLNKNDDTSYVVTPSFPGYIDVEEFQVLRYLSLPLVVRPPYRVGLPKLDFSIKKRVNNIPFNLVHAHSPFSSGQLALSLARKRGIPIVATFHSKFYDDFKEAVKIDLLARLGVKNVIRFFNSVDHVWTVSQSAVETLRDYGFKGKVDVVYNGTDFVPINDPKKSIELSNKYLKVKPEELVFLYVGQQVWQKNLKMLLHSLQCLKQMGVEFKMIFVGKGYAEPDLKQLVNELNIEKNVQFMGMITDRELLKGIFHRANVFLFPSLYDTGGIVVQEAAAMGCPSVVIEGSSVAEQIENNYNGYLTKNDPEIYAKKIFEVTSDMSKLAQIGENAQHTISENWETIVNQVKDRYIEIIRFHSKNR
ncbi:MAG: glycosyltransferase [Halanaerobiales bacterium]|nr:glycosyltransferase [Halanaerobiales bacterium]